MNSSGELLPEQFIGESVTVTDSAFDASVMASGAPGVPSVFSWRGTSYRVRAVLHTGKTNRPCRHGSGERYIDKHVYCVETETGEVMTLYCRRTSGRKAGWTLYSLRKKARPMIQSDKKTAAASSGPLRVAVLVSGGGTNLQAIIDEQRRMNRLAAGAFAEGSVCANGAFAEGGACANGVFAEGGADTDDVAACPYEVCAVFSDRKDAYALERARQAGIPAEIVSPYAVLGADKAKSATRDEKRFAVSDRVLALSRAYEADILVLAGFLTVLGGAVIDAYGGRIINLHPALLPKFGGEGMWGRHVHEAVLASGEAESGCTVHLVDGGCDTGKILLQRRVPVLPGDTPETLYARIAPCEHEALVAGIKMLAELR